ncbi:4-trimethylaminobutyraldehyde dehydrogenase [Bulinus truncatus]|nr:4-trimethylaminobutyraldehyde dehydrogenase [Bulinus truncatus]
MKPFHTNFFTPVRSFSFSIVRSALANSPQVTLPLNFVNGLRVDPHGSTTFPLIVPASGKKLRDIQNSNKEDVDSAVKAARNAFKAWSQWSGFERGQVLRKAANIIKARAEELAYTEVYDTGKPIWEARFDILGCAQTVDYYGGLASTIAGDFISLSGNSFAYTIREPLGVVGAIGAWNYPFQMAAWKSAPALACGNTCVFKPSQFTPLTAVMLAEIYQEAGLPDGCFNVTQGGAETGQQLASHPDVNKISFTGSVESGSKVMSSCAAGIKHVTLELGGKSPLIIFADADLDNAVKGAMLANFTNQGQVCSNGTRVFVEETLAEEFLTKLIERVKMMKIGDPNDDDTTVGATINEAHAKKVLAHIELAQKEGATVAYGGELVQMSNPNVAGGFYLRPCILTNCTDEMTVAKEEIFGAVLSVLTFKTEKEVISRANSTEFGLAGGVFTKDLQRAHRVVSRLEAGAIYINNYNVYPVGVPFGGYKKSGIGRENGPDTLNYYSQIKSVYFEGGNVDCPY